MAKILTSSDCSLCVEFGNAISEEINKQVRSFTVAAEAARIEGVTELVPTYLRLPQAERERLEKERNQK